MDGRYDILEGDVLDRLRELPDGHFHCCVTSPPYFGLRDYQVDGQIGLEPTPEAYVARMVEVFREVRRVLRDDGTAWVNMGDSYANGDKNGAWNRSDNKADVRSNFPGAPNRVPIPGLKPKDLIGMPWRLAFALQADGWWLRSEIIWHKPSPMPESVTDRPTKAHEQVFLLTKRERYFYDAEAVKEGAIKGAAGSRFDTGKTATHQQNRASTNDRDDNGTRNARTVWTIASRPFPEAHFATFPPALPERCIKAGTSERGCCPGCGAPWERVVEPTPDYQEKLRTANDRGDWYARVGTTSKRDDGRKGGNMEPGISANYRTLGWRPTCDHAAEPVPCRVLDPFSGAGTTAMVAAQLGRDATGIELNPEYAAMSRRRIEAALRPNTARADVDSGEHLWSTADD